MGVICQILLDKTEEGVHKAGQAVTGVVKYAIDQPTEYKSITLSLIGKGECRWTESESSDSNGSKSTTYIGRDQYINRRINILQIPEDRTAVVAAGCYDYPFEFILPKDIPPSFKDKICEITYEVILEFKKPQLFNSTKKFDVQLNVYGNVQQKLTFPIIFGAEKTLFKPLSARRNTINLKAEIAKTVVSPGENVNLNYVVTNQSSVAVKNVRIELMSKNVYTADCGKTNMNTKVFKECTVVEKGCDADSIVKGEVVLPTLAELYTIQHTKVIKKEFFARVVLVLPLPHKNEVAEVEVVIGEVDCEGGGPPLYFDTSKTKD